MISKEEKAKNHTVLYVIGIIAVSAIIITSIITFAHPNQNAAQLVKKLQSQLDKQYHSKAGINIYFKRLPKNKAKQTANDLANKISLSKPKQKRLDSRVWYYTTGNKDKTLNITTFYRK